MTALPPDLDAALRTAKEIRVSTRRADGQWSRATPVWFLYDGDALYFTTAPRSHKGRRLQRGSPIRAEIGDLTVEGDTAVVTDPTLITKLSEGYSRKYWIAWLGLFRPRLGRIESGKTLAVKVAPLATDR